MFNFKKSVMKKMITKMSLFLLSFLWIGNMNAQELLIDDFESGNKGWQTVACYQDIRNNPHKEGINTSDKVLFTNRGVTNDNWSGAILPADKLAGSPITGYRYLHAKMYRNNANNPQLKITDGSGAPEINPMSGISIVANKWQDVVFDIGTYPVDYVMFMVDRSATLAAEAQLLVDDIALSNDPSPREPAVIGSMIEMGVPIYPQRDGAAPGTALSGVTFDFKAVTIGTTSWAWTDWHGKTIANNPWSSQFRYWSSTKAKTENNLTGRVVGTQQTYGTTSVAPPNNPLTITFLQEENNNFFETDDFTYDSTIANSADASDTEAPVLTCPHSLSEDLTLELSLSATDNSDNYFYYIVDKANGIEDVVFFDGTYTKKLSAGTDYDIKVYAIDFSGNQSAPEEIQLTTPEIDYSEIPSNYCEYLLGTSDEDHAYLTMTTGDDGKFYMIIAPYNGDTNTSFRNFGYSDDQLNYITVNGNANAGMKYFTRTISDDKMVITYTPVEGMMKPGDAVYFNQVLEYKTSGNTNLWPTLAFTYVYGTGCEGVTPPEPPKPVTYECDGEDILSGIDFTPGVIWYTSDGSNPSTNYTQTWDNGVLDLHLGAATYSQWNAQFKLTCPSQTLVAGKTYFLSFEIKTNVDLPRVYMKVQADGVNDVFVDLPSLNIPAGADTIVSGITVNTAGTFNMILFDFGGNPANADITVSNITVCDNYKIVEDGPEGLTKPGTPTQDPSNVLSIYCTAYSNIAGINYNPNWSQPTQVNPNFPIEDTKVLQYTGLTYQGTEFPDQNVTDMTYLHIEIWTPDAFKPNIYPINHDPLVDTKSYPLDLKANQWNSFDIPLSAFDMPQYAIWQFKFDGGTGNTMYIANWFFYNEAGADTEAPTNFTAAKGTVTKNSVELLLNADDNSGAVFYTVKYGDPVQTVKVGGKAGVQRSYTAAGLDDDTDYTFTVTVADRAGNANPNTLTVEATTLLDGLAKPKVAAPTPTADAENVISVRSSAYTNRTYNFGTWGQSTVVSNVTIEGISTMKLEKFNYSGLEFVGTSGGSLDISGMDYMHIDVWTPNVTQFQIQLAGMADDANVVCTPFNKEVWNSYDLPLTSFTGATLDAVSVMRLQTMVTPNPNENTVYIDNLYFYKDVKDGLNTQPTDKAVVYAADGILHVSGSNEAVAVYNLLGRMVYKNTSTENVSVELAKGVYIVKIGTCATKVLVK